MLSKDRWKTTAGFFVILLLSKLWEEKNYCERSNELSSWRPVALPNRHLHLYLFKLGYDVHVLLSSVMYILSGENITAMFTISRRRCDQNATQVANRLDRARATYVRLLHVPPCPHPSPANECVPPPPPTPNQGWGGHTRLRAMGWGSPSSDDWRKSLPLCLLCGLSKQFSELTTVFQRNQQNHNIYFSHRGRLKILKSSAHVQKVLIFLYRPPKKFPASIINAVLPSTVK